MAEPFSSLGEEIEMGGGFVMLLGGDDEFGGVVPRLGKGWRGGTPAILTAETGVEGEPALALLSERLRYSAIFSWKEWFAGDALETEILLRSSADLDHPFRDMFRRSPNPPPPRLMGLEGRLGASPSA